MPTLVSQDSCYNAPSKENVPLQNVYNIWFNATQHLPSINQNKYSQDLLHPSLQGLKQLYLINTAAKQHHAEAWQFCVQDS